MKTVAFKLGEQLGLAHSKNVSYGEYHGYPLSIRDFGGQTWLEVGATFLDEQQKWTCANEFGQTKAGFKLISAQCTGAGIIIKFKGGMGAQKAIAAFIEQQLWPVLERNSAKGTCCPLCGMELGAPARTWAKIDNEIFCAHGTCLDKKEQQISEVNREAEGMKKNVLPGAAGAVLGAIVGSIPGIAVYLLGYLSVWCGAIIGMGSKKGYELLGGKPGKLKPWFIVLTTIAAYFLSFFFIEIAYSLIDFFKEYDVYMYYGITISVIFKETWKLFFTSEFWKHYGVDVVIGFIFAIIGCVGVFLEVHREGKSPGGRVEYLTDRTGAGV